MCVSVACAHKEQACEQDMLMPYQEESTECGEDGEGEQSAQATEG